MKSCSFAVFLLLFLCVLTVQAQETDTATSTTPASKEYPGHTMIKGLVLQLGTAYIAENNALPTPGLFNVKTGRPSTFNIYFVKQLNLIKNTLSFAPGIGFGFDNYYFEKNLLVRPSGKDLFYIDNSKKYNKTKLAATYVDIPLELQFASSANYKKALKIAVGGKFGVLINDKSKIKYEEDGTDVKVKASDISLNKIRYGVTGRIGFGIFNVFAYYSLSPLFKTQYAPKTQPIIFGISLNSF